MRLRPRLVLLFGLTTLLPLLLTGWMSTTLSREASIGQAREIYARQAQGLALLATSWRQDMLRALELSLSTWDLDQLQVQEIEGLQRVLYRQLDAVNAVATVDRKGNLVVPPAYLSADELQGELSLHQGVSQERVQALISHLVLPEPGQSVAVGQAYDPGDGQPPVLPVAIPSKSGQLILLAEVSLAELQDNFQAQAIPDGAAVLLGAQGQVLAGLGEELLPPTRSAYFSGDLAGDMDYEDGAGQAIVATFRGVPQSQWSVVLALPRQAITRPGDRVAIRVGYIYLIAVVLVAATALVSARKIAQPVLALRRATEALGAGALGEQVELPGRDEIAELGQSFNRMSSDLARQAQVILEKNQEIEGFNLELQARVQERTRELRESQARLVQSSRMAAVAQLGAGLAHELSNPVAGILGLAQLAQAQDDNPLLQAIEGEALRCREILASLRRFSGEGGVSRREPIELQTLVQEVLVLLRGSMEEAQVHVDLVPSREQRTLGDPTLLGQALTQLFRSLRANLSPGGRIEVHGVSRLSEVGLQLTLEGPARPSKDDWLASGMGFWVAQQVLHEHRGRLEEAGPGLRRWTLWLPARPDLEGTGQERV